MSCLPQHGLNECNELITPVLLIEAKRRRRAYFLRTGMWGFAGGGRAEAAPGTWPPPSGKSSVSSRTTWKPLSISFLPPLASVCSSAGRQATTVVVNWTESEGGEHYHPTFTLPPSGTLGLRTLAHQAAPPVHSCRADTGTPSRSPRPGEVRACRKGGRRTGSDMGQTSLIVSAQR